MTEESEMGRNEDGINKKCFLSNHFQGKLQWCDHSFSAELRHKKYFYAQHIMQNLQRLGLFFGVKDKTVQRGPWCNVEYSLMNESKFNFTTHGCVLFLFMYIFLLFCYQHDALINAGNSVMILWVKSFGGARLFHCSLMLWSCCGFTSESLRSMLLSPASEIKLCLISGRCCNIFSYDFWQGAWTTNAKMSQ